MQPRSFLTADPFLKLKDLLLNSAMHSPIPLPGYNFVTRNYMHTNTVTKYAGPIKSPTITTLHLLQLYSSPMDGYPHVSSLIKYGVWLSRLGLR